MSYRPGTARFKVWYTTHQLAQMVHLIFAIKLYREWKDRQKSTCVNLNRTCMIHSKQTFFCHYEVLGKLRKLNIYQMNTTCNNDE